MSYENMFYVQDTRGYCGNCVMWWREGNGGYTTHLSDARLFREDELHEDRETYKPWPAQDVLDAATAQVDIQLLRKATEEPNKEGGG